MFCDFFDFDNSIENIDLFFKESCCNLKFIEEKVNVKIEKQNTCLKILGEVNDVQFCKHVLKIIFNILKLKKQINFEIIKEVFDFLKTGNFKTKIFDLRICLNHRKEVILAKNFNQLLYINSIKHKTITFGVGAAGTGKTYLAVAMAVQALKTNSVNKIIFTRPVLEAGENLGFLPGSFQNKVDPFLKPLYDAMCDFVGIEIFNKNLERGTVEVIPLAYMRGRSLNNSFIVLDEAQNTTSNQMKMFLTRIGTNSKMVINGDLTQIDLPKKIESGLSNAIKILKNIEDIELVEFDVFDVVRNKLVKQILKAYKK